MKFLCTIALALMCSSAFSAETYECGALDSIGNLIELKTVSNGNVRVAYVSTEEPALAPDHILVFVADRDSGALTCTAVGQAEGLGFGHVDMKTLKSVSYDAKKGLLLTIDVTNYLDGDASKPIVENIKIRTNRSTGKASVE